MLKGVIFDFDGTLVDSNEAFIQILRDFLQEEFITAL